MADASAEHIVFLTGHLAEARLRDVLQGLGQTPFTWEVANVGVKVAALMTGAIVQRRLKTPIQADRVIFPGRAGIDPDEMQAHFGVHFERGPEELADLPRFLGRKGGPPDLSKHDLRIFAEIVTAIDLSPDAIVERARWLAADGADVIDVGCKPGRHFAHLEDQIRALKQAGFKVSVDSGDPEELRRGALAGADFLLSLNEDTLDVVDGTAAVPVLLSKPHGDLDSLVRAARKADAKGIDYMLDPVLDPINFGFTDSLMRYVRIREMLPKAEIMMGTGNLTELTDADTSGITATLVGICTELRIRNVLIVHVSPHTRRTVAEHDVARRMMFAARAHAELPRNYTSALLHVHDRWPYAQSSEDIAGLASEIRDSNFRIAVAEDGIHVFNGTLHQVSDTAFPFFPHLGVEQDGAHGFYLGAELMKAEIAYALGKRYTQDEPLDWGCAVRPGAATDRTRLADAGHTLKSKQEREERKRASDTAPDASPPTGQDDIP
ncbi:DUF6513 domain-containing protein [Granulibacter bethesdensis]|uniref:DUF6513 domain-containing protein n=1 Tax=Granulibacter bethesdensis TaxID=364410 RepID=UPI0003F1F1E1|nr:DUF6513 domain-containing protein [Granulibacter bethesdensis]AHJ69519.1 Dihydropteroate synthase [Granulibacter bethesdensis]